MELVNALREGAKRLEATVDSILGNNRSEGAARNTAISVSRRIT